MIDMTYWCESCARKNNCYTIRSKPKCFTPITSNDRTADRKTEPQRTCEECKHYLFTDIDGYYCEHETYGQPCRYEPKTEPQTEKPKIRKRIDKPFRAVWLDDDHNEIGTPQAERSE